MQRTIKLNSLRILLASSLACLMSVVVGCESDGATHSGTGVNSESASTDDPNDTNTTVDSDSLNNSDSDAGSDSSSDNNGDGIVDDECVEGIDLVFVLDVSTTMRETLGTLRDEIELVWNAARAIDEGARFGMVVFVDDYLFLNDGAAYGSVQEIQADFTQWYTHTDKNQQVIETFINTDYAENSLDALFEATHFTWRSSADAVHIIIHATDNTFREAPDVFTNSVAAEHTYQEVVTELQDNEIRVAAFANSAKPEGWSEPYNDSPSIPEATSGGFFEIGDVGTTVSLADAIVAFVETELCEEYAVVVE